MLRGQERDPAKSIAVKSPERTAQYNSGIGEPPGKAGDDVGGNRSWLGRNLCVFPATAENKDGGRARVLALLSTRLGEKRAGSLRPPG
ncbi:hypothetical protein NDU88_000060 [Pleurodeles waltl]|uniref:Uncharacterized protein n=1 Tax=Pleurodeles waltl TaxID=8319 RepID=A0AAV7TDY9_PLEWA|nr:hypothetical protein NDU88_000060 [Pleurodeles waltl]